MNLEQQVCSLELAKRLKELGVKQESLFHHWVDNSHKSVVQNERHSKYQNVSAFTVAELGEMLPDDYAVLKASKKKWYSGNRGNLKYTQPGSTMANAAAKMLVYLLENKLHSL